MSKEQINESKGNLTETQGNSEEKHNQQEYVTVKGNLQDLTYFIRKLLEDEKTKIVDGHESPLARYNFSEEEYRAITEFCIDANTRVSEDEEYAASFRLPGTKILLTFDKSLLISIVITLVSVIGTATAPPITLAGGAGIASGLYGSYLSIKNCLHKIDSENLCVLLDALEKKQGIITPINVKLHLMACPHAQLYQKVYGEKCPYCSYCTKSPTLYECHMTESDIEERLKDIAAKMKVIEHSKGVFKLKK